MRPREATCSRSQGRVTWGMKLISRQGRAIPGWSKWRSLMRCFTFCSHEVFAQVFQFRPHSSRAHHPCDGRTSGSGCCCPGQCGAPCRVVLSFGSGLPFCCWPCSALREDKAASVGVGPEASRIWGCWKGDPTKGWLQAHNSGAVSDGARPAGRQTEPLCLRPSGWALLPPVSPAQPA